MRPPTVTRQGGGESLGDAPDRTVELLSDHDSLHATWSRYGPRRDGADLHVHHHHTDYFYVLAGELTVRLGEDETVAVPPGTLACAPPLVVHGFRNDADADVVFLNLHAPGAGFADFMRGLRDRRAVDFDQAPPPSSGVRPSSDAVVTRDGVDHSAIAIAEVRHEGGDPETPRAGNGVVGFFYVLDGELALLAGGRELHAQAGSWLQVPPGVPHTVGSAAPDPVRFLDILTPVAAG